MIRILSILVILSLSQIALAQKTSIILSGQVLNVENNQPLENVTILLEKETRKGTTTNKDGQFELEVESFPVTLIFSIIGFETQRLTIENQEAILVNLLPVSTELPEIVVSAARKIDTVYQEPFNVVDFVFKDEYLILLVYKNVFEKYELVLLDEDEKVLSQLSLKEEKPAGLFKSCLGYLYLDTYFGVRRIELNEEQFELGDWVEKEIFDQIIEPCVLSVDSFLFYKKYQYQGQALRYYVFKNNGERSDSLVLLPLLEDEANIVRLVEETGNRLPWSGDFWTENISDGLRVIREEPYFLKGAFRMFYPKLYAPIIKKDSTICLFNHLASRIQFFDSKGKMLKETPIQYHKIKRWKKYILHDEIRNEVYTAFHTRWGEYICQIDLETGALSEAIPLDLDFIEKVRIRNGVLYFLHRDAYQGAQNRMIQKVRVN